VQAGRLKAIAVTGAARYPDWPNVPTMIESGFPQLSLGFWPGSLARSRFRPTSAASSASP